MPDPVYVAVIGPGQADPATAAAAQAVGALLGAAGAVLVCGGGGGAMEAACRGAKEAGGTTLGILPGTTRAAANRYVDLAVPTGLGEARNALVVRTADAVVAVGGGTGTLSEIALALKIGRPVVGLATWEARLPGSPGGPSGSGYLPVVRAPTPEEAVAAALRLAAEAGGSGGGRGARG